LDVAVTSDTNVTVTAALTVGAADIIHRCVVAGSSAFARLRHTMLTGSAIRIRCAIDTTVVFDPAATFASRYAVSILVAFDTHEPVRGADLSPSGAKLSTFFKIPGVRSLYIAAIKRWISAIYIKVEPRAAARQNCDCTAKNNAV
jgi:hypothetical protein